MPLKGIILVLLVCGASAAPRTKEHEWRSAERSVRSDAAFDREIRTALEAALEGQQEEEKVVLVTEKPVFVKDDDDEETKPEVKPQDENYVVPSYSPVGSENEFGSEDTNKLTPSLILGIEKQLQDEMGQMEGQLSVMHKLISSMFGQQGALQPNEDFDPNVVVVDVPQHQNIGNHNPFNFGGFPFWKDDDIDDVTDDNEGDDTWNWFHGQSKFPSLSDVFGFPDSKSNNTFGFPEFGDIGLSKNNTDFGFPNFFGDLPDKWSNLPNNYTNSTHEVQHVNGSVINVEEEINKQSGDGFNFFSHKQVIGVHPEIEDEVADSEEQAEEANEENENAKDQSEEADDFEDNEEITQNENEIVGLEKEEKLTEKEIENELSEFSELKIEDENKIEDEEAYWRSEGPEEFSLSESLDAGGFPLVKSLDEREFEGDEREFSPGETLNEAEFSLGETQDYGEFSLEETLDGGEFSLGETLDEGEFSMSEELDERLNINHEPLLLPSDQLVLPETAVFGSEFENIDQDHELVDFFSDQLSMPDKSAYYDIRSLEHGNKNIVHDYESTYRDLSDDTRVNRISANKSGMRRIEPHAEIFDYKRVLEESKPIQ